MVFNGLYIIMANIINGYGRSNVSGYKEALIYLAPLTSIFGIRYDILKRRKLDSLNK